MSEPESPIDCAFLDLTHPSCAAAGAVDAFAVRTVVASAAAASPFAGSAASGSSSACLGLRSPRRRPRRQPAWTPPPDPTSLLLRSHNPAEDYRNFETFNSVSHFQSCNYVILSFLAIFQT